MGVKNGVPPAILSLDKNKIFNIILWIKINLYF